MESRWQVLRSLPEQEADLHTAVLSNSRWMHVSAYQLAAKVQQKLPCVCVLVVGTREQGKEGWSSCYVVDMTSTLSRRRST